MWFVKGGRASGKTALLIRQSALTGTPILVSSVSMASILKERARGMGLRIPEPIAWKPKAQGTSVQEVLIDDGEYLIDRIVEAQTGLRCVGMAINGPLTVLERPLPKEMLLGAHPGTRRRLEIDQLLNGAWDGECVMCARGNGKSRACAGMAEETEEKGNDSD